MEIKNFSVNDINSVESVKLGKKQAKIILKQGGFIWASMNHEKSRKYTAGETVCLKDCQYYITDSHKIHLIVR